MIAFEAFKIFKRDVVAFHTFKETTFFPREGMWGCARDYARNVGRGVWVCARKVKISPTHGSQGALCDAVSSSAVEQNCSASKIMAFVIGLVSRTVFLALSSPGWSASSHTKP